MEIFVKDISEMTEFVKEGETFKLYEYVEEYKKYIYQRFNKNGRMIGWEVIKPKRYVNPGGEIVYTYPSTSDFGHYGWFLPPIMKRKELLPWLDGSYKTMWNKKKTKK